MFFSIDFTENLINFHQNDWLEKHIQKTIQNLDFSTLRASQNPPKTLPKPIQNPSKIEEKSKAPFKSKKNWFFAKNDPT